MHMQGCIDSADVLWRANLAKPIRCLLCILLRLMQMYSVGRGFVGTMHLESMVRLLGYSDLPIVIEAIIDHMKQKVSGSNRSVLKANACAMNESLFHMTLASSYAG